MTRLEFENGIGIVPQLRINETEMLLFSLLIGRVHFKTDEDFFL